MSSPKISNNQKKMISNIFKLVIFLFLTITIVCCILNFIKKPLDKESVVQNNSTSAPMPTQASVSDSKPVNTPTPTYTPPAYIPTYTPDNALVQQELTKWRNNKKYVLPSLIYKDKENNIIREYQMGLTPTGRDHKGKAIYIDLNSNNARSIIENKLSHYYLYNGKENIGKIPGQYKNGFELSKANFNLVFTNQTDHSPICMTSDAFGEYNSKWHDEYF